MRACSIAQLQYRAAVETEPAHPQDEGTQGSQRQVGTGDSVYFTVRTVLAFTSTQQQHTSQSSSSTSHVNDAGTSKVREAQVAQVIHAKHVGTTPGPGTFQRVDHTGHEYREDQEGPQLHTLGNRTGDDGHGGSHEHHLEEEVGRTRVDGVTIESVLGRCAQHTGQIEGFDTVQEDAAAVHDGVTTHQVHDAANGKQRHVLGENFGGVFRTHQTGFQHGKTGSHPHYQCATHQKVKGVHGVLKFKNLIFHNATLRKWKRVL